MFTTPELLYILQHGHKYGENKLMIETSGSETEFGTTHYSFHLYYKRQILEEFQQILDKVSSRTDKEKVQARYKEYLIDGACAVLDFDCVITSDDFHEALRRMLGYQIKNKQLR